MGEVRGAEVRVNAELDAVVEKYGEVKVLERLTAMFDHLFQEGVIRRPAEQEKIRRLLKTIDGRISWRVTGPNN
jgi:hypothetical protein